MVSEKIRKSSFRKFPPRLPEQPIFYVVLTPEYAVQIAKDWNTRDERSGFAGYVTRFRVRADYLKKYAIRTVGGRIHREYWIPAQAIDKIGGAVFPGRPGRDPPDKAKGGGRKKGRCRGKSGGRQGKRKSGRTSDEDAGTVGNERKKKRRGGRSRSSEDEMTVTTERPDDVPFLIGAMMRMGMHEITDRHVPRHPLRRDLSWGMTAVIWLAYVLSEGDSPQGGHGGLYKRYEAHTVLSDGVRYK